MSPAAPLVVALFRRVGHSGLRIAKTFAACVGYGEMLSHAGSARQLVRRPGWHVPVGADNLPLDPLDHTLWPIRLDKATTQSA